MKNELIKQILIKLIAAYTALASLMSPKLGAVYQEIPPEVKTPTATEYVLRFKNADGIIESTTTQEEYDKLSQKDSSAPIKDGYVFAGGYAKTIFATTTPTLTDYKYFKVGTDPASTTPKIKVKKPDLDPQIIYLDQL